MPRGRPKKTTAEVEILPPEETNQPLQQVREVKHKTEWVELRSVEETPEEEAEEFADGSIEDKPRRKAKDEHTKLRELLAQHNIAPSAQLRLSIERYLHSESSEGGTWSDKEFLTRYICTKEQIVNEDYLDVARKWGAGTYWFTLRMYTPGKSPGSRIVASWEKRLGPATPNIQHVNPADPNSPQVIVQTNGDGQQQVQPMSMRDIMKAQKEAFKEQLEMAKLMREAYGMQPEQQQQPRSEEEILSSAILKQPEVIENVVGSVIKRFGGASSKDDEPWYADVVRDAVKSGQLVQVVQVAIDRIFNGFGNLFPGRQNNGQAEMASTPLPQQNVLDAASVGSQSDQGGQSANPQTQPQGSSSVVETSPNAPPGQQQTVTPEDQALQLLIEHCRRGAPVRVAYGRLMEYAGLLNEQYPQGSIDDYVDIFAAMPIEAALEFVKTQPNGEQVVSLPHAQQWTAELQRLIKEAGQEGDEE